MTLTGQVMIGIMGVVFSAGVAWGMVRASIKKQNNEIEELKKAVKDLGDCDKIVRHYLFASDGTSNYMTVANCIRGHEKLDERLNRMSEKIDKILEKVTALK